MRTLSSIFTCWALWLGAAACSEVTVEPFPPGQGQDPNASSVPYPAGPYSVAVGSVMPNLPFVGFVNPSADSGAEVPIQLADFYNPTGEDLYPADSPFGEKAKPRVLWINVSSVWCGPCQYESAEILPEEYAKYAPQGAELLLVLADSAVVGDPAKVTHLRSWTQKYGSAWPSVIDPPHTLANAFPGGQYPVNIVIDTETMKVEAILNGIPEEGSGFYASLESTLAL